MWTFNTALVLLASCLLGSLLDTVEVHATPPSCPPALLSSSPPALLPACPPALLPSSPPLLLSPCPPIALSPHRPAAPSPCRPLTTAGRRAQRRLRAAAAAGPRAALAEQLLHQLPAAGLQPAPAAHPCSPPLQPSPAPLPRNPLPQPSPATLPLHRSPPPAHVQLAAFTLSYHYGTGLQDALLVTPLSDMLQLGPLVLLALQRAARRARGALRGAAWLQLQSPTEATPASELPPASWAASSQRLFYPYLYSRAMMATSIGACRQVPSSPSVAVAWYPCVSTYGHRSLDTLSEVSRRLDTRCVSTYGHRSLDTLSEVSRRLDTRSE